MDKLFAYYLRTCLPTSKSNSVIGERSTILLPYLRQVSNSVNGVVCKMNIVSTYEYVFPSERKKSKFIFCSQERFSVHNLKKRAIESSHQCWRYFWVCVPCMVLQYRTYFLLVSPRVKSCFERSGYLLLVEYQVLSTTSLLLLLLLH